ncbi:MAG: ATP-dependent DNA helicase PcrA, partial [Syntrophomonadaceae bacterium]|nr:ATP-dependent DNA helicase PcrA [Syntrophomonadaceae bacterium]
PHSMCILEPDQLEEERRLCYVGITRAREELYLTRALTRTLYGSQRNNLVSRFLKEIPTHLLTQEGPRIDSRSTDARKGKRKGESISYTPTNQALVHAGSSWSKWESQGWTAIPPSKKSLSRAPARIEEGERLSLTVGDRVVHAKWGPGVVVQVRGQGAESQVAVAFPEQGIKQLLLGYAPLERAKD